MAGARLYACRRCNSSVRPEGRGYRGASRNPHPACLTRAALLRTPTETSTTLEILGGLDVAAALVGGYLWVRTERPRASGPWYIRRHSRLRQQHIRRCPFLDPGVECCHRIILVSRRPTSA